MVEPPPGSRTSPSAARNREPILRVLQRYLPAEGLVLEIASGTGEHAIFCAAAVPKLLWRPSDPDAEALASIEAWREQAALPNLLAPLRLDAAFPEDWPIDQADAIVNINMVHISAWSATRGLMCGAGRLLPAGGVLFLYGPFLEYDAPTAASNLDFDQSLKSRNPSWGLRNLGDVIAVAAEHGMTLTERIEMPANNLSLVFHKEETTLRL
jgi:SAM-dependent methyltransferase